MKYRVRDGFMVGPLAGGAVVELSPEAAQLHLHKLEPASAADIEANGGFWRRVEKTVRGAILVMAKWVTPDGEEHDQSPVEAAKPQLTPDQKQDRRIWTLLERERGVQNATHEIKRRRGYSGASSHFSVNRY